MVVDGHTFMQRAQKFFSELQANRYPNSQSLAKLCICSKNTAQRTIYRLRDEYLFPMEYDSSEKGYYLTNRNFSMPHFLPAGKDELAALLLARDLIKNLDAKDINQNLDRIWHQFISNNTQISRELEPLLSFFSSDLTVVGDVADFGVLRYVTAASTGESVRITYKSPWRHKEERIYEGQILKVHFSDGSLYLLFHDGEGHKRILNCSFIRSLSILDATVKPPPLKPGEERIISENWLQGFGIWAGEPLEDIEIKILPPAAEYYASQRWHADQEDEWEGEILVRKLRAITSPEIVRRILSVGKYITSIKPEKLRDETLSHIEAMRANL